MTFLSVAAGAFLGNILTLFVVGLLVKRNEAKQLAEAKKLQEGYLEMVRRERARLENYAKMES